MKFGRNAPWVNTRRLTESDFGYDVILSRWLPWGHFAKPLCQPCVTSLARCMRYSTWSIPGNKDGNELLPETATTLLPTLTTIIVAVFGNFVAWCGQAFKVRVLDDTPALCCGFQSWQCVTEWKCASSVKMWQKCGQWTVYSEQKRFVRNKNFLRRFIYCIKNNTSVL